MYGRNQHNIVKQIILQLKLNKIKEQGLALRLVVCSGKALLHLVALGVSETRGEQGPHHTWQVRGQQSAGTELSTLPRMTVEQQDRLACRFGRSNPGASRNVSWFVCIV